MSAVRFCPWSPYLSIRYKFPVFNPCVIRYNSGTLLLEMTHGNYHENPLEHLEIDHPQARLADSHQDVPHQADVQDWARRTEDEMVRGVYIDCAGSDRILLKHALDRYILAEIVEHLCRER